MEAAIRVMFRTKAVSPDGFSALFYKKIGALWDPERWSVASMYLIEKIVWQTRMTR